MAEYELIITTDAYARPDNDWLDSAVERLFGGEWLGGGSDFVTYNYEFGVPREISRAELLEFQALILKEEGVQASLFCERYTPDEDGDLEANIISSTEEE